MKKSVSAILVILLVLVGLGAAFVINDPVAVRRLSGFSSEESRPAKPRAAQASGQAPAGEQTFDRKTAAPPPAADRPPTREEFEKERQEEAPIVEVSRKARFIGPRDEAGSDEPPAVELYPFTVNRRTYPDANSITVELAVRNASGTHWRAAYITLRSPMLKRGQLFEIKEWKIDEVVGVDYTFPRGEVSDRMKGLRIVSVSGEKRDSALADRLEGDRLRLLKNDGTATTNRRPGDQLNAPGLLSVMGQFQEPFTGIEVTATELNAPEKQVVIIEIPADSRIPETMESMLRETSDERHEVAQLIRKFHESALGVQTGIDDFVKVAESGPYRDAMATQGNASLAALREQLKGFNQSGRDLALRVHRSQDAEVRRVSGQVTDYSKKILDQIKAVETAIRPVDPTFRVQESK